jgi:ABC-type dipeptide/oligopeptide/nickel transport system permease component
VVRKTRSWFRLPVTLGISFLVLTAMLWNAPGRGLDESLWGQSTLAAAETAERQWSSYGQFAAWYVIELSHGRGGNSTQYGVPVGELIAERASVTVGHAWRGFAAAWLFALMAGVASHFWPAAGRAALGAGSLLLSLPSAFVVLTIVLAGAAPWVGLAVCLWPKAHSYWETLLVSVRRRPHVLSLLSQGAGPWRVQWHAVWRPNLRQLLGLLAVTVPLLLGAVIPVEVLCDQPGLGQLAWRAVTGRDLPLLTSLTLLFTAVTCGMSLLAESLKPEAQ